MVLGGLLATLAQLAQRLSAAEVIAQEATSRTERSPMLYPMGDGSVLEEHGNSSLILHLSRGLLFFGSAFQIQERVEERIKEGPPLLFLVLDCQQIQEVEVTGAKVLQ